MTITIKGEHLILDKDRSIYLPEHALLAISDLHLGKSAHFRKAGLQVPASIALGDLNRLSFVIKKYQPKTLLINGDMFHHDVNTDVDVFSTWRKQYKELHILLVKGNHDKLLKADYANFGIEVCDPKFSIGKLCFIHDQLKGEPQEELYSITGHLHPGITIIGKAKQRLKFPCFYFGEKCAVMPAFSLFTGIFNIKQKLNDRIFAITPDRLIEV